MDILCARRHHPCTSSTIRKFYVDTDLKKSKVKIDGGKQVGQLREREEAQKGGGKGRREE